jgi:hypothetical protein
VPPLCEADLGERRLLPVGGVVDQDVEPAKARERCLDHCLHGGFVGDVGEVDQGLAAAILDLGRDRRRLGARAAGVDHDRGAVAGQRQRDRPADPTHRPGDQSDPPSELSRIFHVRLPSRARAAPDR